MEIVARTKTTKGRKIRVNEIEKLDVRDRSKVEMDIAHRLVEYETPEEFRKAFPKSKEEQQFLIAQKKDDALTQQERELSIKLVGTEEKFTRAIGLETPYMKLLSQMKMLQQHKKYYILAVGSKSKCEKQKENIIKKQDRNEQTIIRLETIGITTVLLIIKEVITNIDKIINFFGI